VSFAVDPSLIVAVAVSCCVCPVRRVTDVGARLRERTITVTVTEALALMPVAGSVAVTVADP